MLQSFLNVLKQTVIGPYWYHMFLFLIHAKNEVVTNVGAKLLYVFGRIYSRSWESELLPAGIWWQLYKWCHRVQMERSGCWDGCSPEPLTVTEVRTSPRLHLLFLDVACWSANTHFCGHQGDGGSFPLPHACRLPPFQFLNAIPVMNCSCGCYDKYYSFSITTTVPTAALLKMRLLLVQSATTNSQYASVGAWICCRATL